MSEGTDRKSCPACGESIAATAKKCRFCGEIFDEELRRASEPTPGGAERMLLPVGRPISAIASGYLALFGIIPGCGLPFSIGALITGIVALKAIKKDPSLSGSGRAWFGIVVGGIMTLISAVVLVGMLIASLTAQPHGGFVR
jgi:hypothetical protein